MSDLSTHLAKLETHLARYRENGILNLIDGKDATATETFETRSPVDESLICSVARGTAADVNAAARAAKAAFPAWAATSGEARKKILHRIADLIVERAEEIALCECWDTGQAYRFMSKAALRGAENLRYYADLAPGARDGQSLPTKSHLNITSRSAIGPVGVITPWNTPFMLSTWKIAPALAAGCTVVHKPAEFSPLTARILAEIAHEAGLPAGVWNLVNGFGEDAGKALTEHPDIKAIAFVGESRTGSMIMKQGADTLKRVHFELGGKNPVIVFDDADLDRALDAAIFMIYSLNGERCTSSSRLLVQETIADEFEARLAERVNSIRVGHPLDPATEVGPLIHKVHFDKVTDYVGIGKTDGATLAAGGERIGDAGWFIQPTFFTHADTSMRIAQEEVFGPFLTSIRFRDEAEALAIANDVQYGLTGYSGPTT
jgi:5-carboxymethyl-2-hydroxymuconic-semialdehyde dehydrogenase